MKKLNALIMLVLIPLLVLTFNLAKASDSSTPEPILASDKSTSDADIDSKIIAIITGEIVDSKKVPENRDFKLDASKSISSHKITSYEWTSNCEQVELVGQDESIAKFKTLNIDEDVECSITLVISDEKNTASTKTDFRVTNTVVVEQITLTSIAIKSPATKLTYFVGETTLDTTGLVIEGTYSDGTKKIETTLSISGFNSSVPTTSKELKITVNGISTIYTTYTINIIAMPPVVTVPPTSGGGGGYIGGYIPLVNPIVPQVLSEKITPQVLGEKITTDNTNTAKATFKKAMKKYDLKLKTKLRTGSKDNKTKEVSALQGLLKQLGFFKYPTITGYFGNQTATALKAFQKANGLEPVGYIGPKTLALLNN